MGQAIADVMGRSLSEVAQYDRSASREGGRPVQSVLSDASWRLLVNTRCCSPQRVSDWRLPIRLAVAMRLQKALCELQDSLLTNPLGLTPCPTSRAYRNED